MYAMSTLEPFLANADATTLASHRSVAINGDAIGAGGSARGDIHY
jgi:hypothetical protein